MKTFPLFGNAQEINTSHLSNRSLRAVLVAAVLTVIVAIVGLIATIYFSYERAAEIRLSQESHAIAAVGRLITKQYLKMERAIDDVVESLDFRDPATTDVASLSEIKARVDKGLRTNSIEVNIWLPDGSSAIIGRDGPNIRDRDWYRALINSDGSSPADDRVLNSETGSAYGGPVVGRIRDIRVLPIARAYRNYDGQLLAIVTATIPEDDFVNIFSMMVQAKNDAAFFFRNDYIGLIREPYDKNFSGQSLPNALVFQNYPQQESGRFEGKAATDGIRRIGVHLGLSPLPLVLGISFEHAPFSRAALEASAPFLIVSLIVVCSVLPFASLAYSAMRRSVIRQRQTQAIFASAHDGIITLDENLRVTAMNKAAEQLFGATEMALVGGPLDPLLPAAVRARHAGLMHGMTQVQDVSRAMSNWRTVKGLHASGREFPAMVSISKVTLLGTPMYLAMVRDMSDIDAFETGLIEAVDDQKRLRILAERAVAAKSVFLATMSHELRTPLNAIIGFSESIAMGYAGPVDSPKYREYIKLILDSGRHLLSLINDILDLSRIQGGAAIQDVEPVDLQRAVVDTISLLRSQIEIKNIQIIEDITEAGILRTDRRALIQVLINILGNAVKFSPPRGRISVRATRRDDGGSLIEVRDEGRGMSAELLARIGEPFLQERKLMVADNHGTGLGLSITIELLKLMGGRLTLRNVEPTGLMARIDFDASTWVI